MLIIRHRSGPLAGKEETPQGRQPDRIVFGRDPADPEEAVINGSIVELGHHGGPSFEVVVPQEANTGELARTLPQEAVVASHAASHHAERSAQRARRLGLAAVVLAVVAAVAGGTYSYFQVQSDRQFQDRLAALNEAAARLAADTIPRQYRDTLAKAAFLVVQRDSSGHERGAATAFPIGP